MPTPTKAEPVRKEFIQEYCNLACINCSMPRSISIPPKLDQQTEDIAKARDESLFMLPRSMCASKDAAFYREPSCPFQPVVIKQLGDTLMVLDTGLFAEGFERLGAHT
jgi:hypothetical protein